ncbi:MAG: hypothetical protein EA381_17375 [Planctomycetaceae bacterium]|nr:MAG: hypothetical protein EA381_17375 [Planctomycetaceae bacterium]
MTSQLFQKFCRVAWLVLFLLVAIRPGVAFADTPVRLATDPALSPDGQRLVFAHAGDLWIVPTRGGVAQRLTTDPADDSHPHFSPDGKRLAFISRRSGSPQVWVQSLNAQGRVTGTPRQVTHHTSGYQLEGWYPDGEHVLVSASRDDHWYARENGRFYRVAVDRREADQIWFDDYGTAPSLSPDGTSLLFQREGVAWWRKGYRGSQAAQIWRYDAETQAFTELRKLAHGDRSPLWKPDASGFYFVSQASGTFDLWEHDFEAGEDRQLTHFDDDSVVMPALSRDGSTLVFRHLFDFYRLETGEPDAKPQRIAIRVGGDWATDRTLRRRLDSVSQAAFTPDGLEIAVVAGGDLWVMDTELREPVNVTASPGEESDPIFVDEGRALLFLKQVEGTVQLWRAEPEDSDRFWWQQSSFRLRAVLDFPDTVTAIGASPDGCRIAYVRKPGQLYVADTDGGEPKLIVSGFDVPDYDFSPDGRWLAYAQRDNDFNSDIWIVPTDGSQPAVNVSRHPKNDYSPKWSPDGRILAFSGVRDAENSDLHYVYLKRDDADATGRDRTLEKAVKKIVEARKAKPGESKQLKPAEAVAKKESDAAAEAARDVPTKVEIDLEDIHERVQRIRIPNESVRGLFWFGHDQTLAFRTTIDGREGTYVVEFPDKRTPRLLTTDRGSFSGRLKDPKRVGWVSSSAPATLGTDGKVDRYNFSARQELDAGERFAAGFDVAWRLMRDNWYDDRMGNRNWDAVRRKYAEMAGEATDVAQFTTVVQLMLGELNGSHLGFSPSGGASSADENDWRPQTAHLGVRFDRGHRGPGLLIRDVLTGGPADRVASQLRPGETILSIDGVAVDPDFDLTQVLNGPLDRDVTLLVRGVPPTPGTKPSDPEVTEPKASEPKNTKPQKAKKKKSEAKESEPNTSEAKTSEAKAKKPKASQNRQSPPVEAGDGDDTVKAEKTKAESKSASPKSASPDTSSPDELPTERTVAIRPISLSQAFGLLYPMWEADNRRRVEEMSGGRLGYLHIQGMNLPSLYEFERQLFNVGYDKEGLVIDVRGNGGGSTADRLLTALTQPRHAITVPRGGGRGYPQDRTVYATWDKPIIVLCNQNSFSNAEIFSHAIRLLGRGRLVGVTTAGGVISTGAAPVMDLGTLRQPFRGWFGLESGQDMELNGAQPHVEIWPLPGDLADGKDRVLERAVRMLTRDVDQAKRRPAPPLIRATERDSE